MNKEEEASYYEVYLRRILKEAYELGKNDGWEVDFNELSEKWLKNLKDINKLQKNGVLL